MVTSFRALSSMVPLRRGSGLVLDWRQESGVIYAGGDSRTIRLWDAHRECTSSVRFLYFRFNGLNSFWAIFSGYLYKDG